MSKGRHAYEVSPRKDHRGVELISDEPRSPKLPSSWSEGSRALAENMVRRADRSKFLKNSLSIIAFKASQRTR
jgi:hypothetical protein